MAAIEFVPVIALAAAAPARRGTPWLWWPPWAASTCSRDVRLAGEPLGFVFAFANAVLFGLYIVLAHRVAQGDGVDGLAAAMLVAAVCVIPLGTWHAAPALTSPALLGAGIGVGVSSSVIPYVCDQLAMARMARATYALLVSLLPATATVIGAVVLGQVPMPAEVAGIGLVVAEDCAPPGAWLGRRERRVGAHAADTARLALGGLAHLGCPVFERGAQLGPASVDPAAYGAHLHAERRGDLLVRQALDVAQDDRGAVFRGEGVERRLDVAVEMLIVVCLGRAGFPAAQPLGRVVTETFEADPLLAAYLVEEEVRRDAVQPTLERAGSVDSTGNGTRGRRPLG